MSIAVVAWNPSIDANHFSTKECLDNVILLLELVLVYFSPRICTVYLPRTQFDIFYTHSCTTIGIDKLFEH